MTRPAPRRKPAAAAKQRQLLEQNLPLDRERAEKFIEAYVVPMIKHAGMRVTMRRMGGTRTLVVRLPK